MKVIVLIILQMFFATYSLENWGISLVKSPVLAGAFSVMWSIQTNHAHFHHFLVGNILA